MQDGWSAALCFERVIDGEEGRDRLTEKSFFFPQHSAQGWGMLCCDTLAATLTMETAVTHTAHCSAIT